MRTDIRSFSTSARLLSWILSLAVAALGTPATASLMAQERWSATIGSRLTVPAGELSDWDTGLGIDASLAWRPGRFGLGARVGYVTLGGEPDLGLWTVGAGPRWDFVRPHGDGSLAVALEARAGAVFLDAEHESRTVQMVPTAAGPAFLVRSVGPVDESVPFLETALTASLPLGGPFTLGLRAGVTWAFVGDPVVTASETLVSAADGRVLAERSLASVGDFPLFSLSPTLAVRF